MRTGTVVWYNDGPDGYNRDDDRLGLFVKADGDKDVVQTANGSHARLTYREPGDPSNTEPDNRGVTYWKVPTVARKRKPAAK